MTSSSFKSEVFEAIHESAKALRKVGAIDKRTLRAFDKACLIGPRTNFTPR